MNRKPLDSMTVAAIWPCVIRHLPILMMGSKNFITAETSSIELHWQLIFCISIIPWIVHEWFIPMHVFTHEPMQQLSANSRREWSELSLQLVQEGGMALLKKNPIITFTVYQLTNTYDIKLLSLCHSLAQSLNTVSVSCDSQDNFQDRTPRPCAFCTAAPLLFAILTKWHTRVTCLNKGIIERLK